jgi:hypothetical protein
MVRQCFPGTTVPRCRMPSLGDWERALSRTASTLSFVTDSYAGLHPCAASRLGISLIVLLSRGQSSYDPDCIGRRESPRLTTTDRASACWTPLAAASHCGSPCWKICASKSRFWSKLPVLGGLERFRDSFGPRETAGPSTSAGMTVCGALAARMNACPDTNRSFGERGELCHRRSGLDT